MDRFGLNCRPTCTGLAGASKGWQDVAAYSMRMADGLRLLVVFSAPAALILLTRAERSRRRVTTDGCRGAVLLRLQTQTGFDIETAQHNVRSAEAAII